MNQNDSCSYYCKHRVLRFLVRQKRQKEKKKKRQKKDKITKRQNAKFKHFLNMSLFDKGDIPEDEVKLRKANVKEWRTINKLEVKFVARS